MGCKIYIRRSGPDGEEEERLAEVLSIRDRPSNPYVHRGNLKKEDTEMKLEDQWEYFVHWDSFNKRLDDWVLGSRLVLTRDLEWPRPKLTGGKKGSTPVHKVPGKAARSLLKRATTNAAFAASPTPGHLTPIIPLDYSASPSPTPTSLKRRHRSDDEEEEEEEEEPPDDEDADAEGEMDLDEDGEVQTFELSDAMSQDSLPTYSKEQEIEKLRTSGSMTQSVSEIARVKNLNRLQIGKHEVDAWYFSPYPKEYAHLPVLYICEFCLSFFPSSMMLSRHRQRCTMLHPPGNEIYRHEDISFYEIDGKRQLTWCRNLSLLSKCFLDQ